MNQIQSAPPRLLWVFTADKPVLGRIKHLGSTYALESGKSIGNGAAQCVYTRMDYHATRN